MIIEAGSTLEVQGLPPFQTCAFLFTFVISTSSADPALAIPHVKAFFAPTTGGVTHRECDDMRPLSGTESLSDKTGSVVVNVTLALLGTVVVVCSSVYLRVSADASGFVATCLCYSGVCLHTHH